MPSPQRILKQTLLERASHASGGGFEEAREADRPIGPRVAARHVQFENRTPAPDEEMPYRLRGILRKSEAYLQETVVELDAPQFVPDYPLSQEPERTPEDEPADEGDDASPDIDALKAEWDAAWETRLEEAVEEARQAGFEQGSEAAQHAIQAEVDATMQTFLEAAGQFTGALQAYIARCEPLLADLAFQVAETLLDAPLPTHIKSVSSKTLSQAIEHLAADPPVDIALHPVDFLHLQETGLIDQLQATHERLRWHPDSKLKQGDWTVQSPQGAIRRLQDELMATLRQRLQTVRPPQPEAPTLDAPDDTDASDATNAAESA